MQPADESCALALRRVEGGLPLLAVFERLRAGRNAWLLESALAAAAGGRYSLAGADPYARIEARGGAIDIECWRPVRKGMRPGRQRLGGDPLALARAWLPRLDPCADAGDLPFVGGAILALAYEYAERLEHLGPPLAEAARVPDLTLLLVDRLVVWDHERDETWLVALGFGPDAAAADAAAGCALDELARQLEGLTGDDPAPDGRVARAADARPVAATFDAAAHARALARIQQAITAGELYQACFTQRLQVEGPVDAWRLYRELRRTNPAPFAAQLELDGVTLVCSSPERFLRVDADGRVESRPIKGTRPRAADPARDAALREELAASAKDRAENLMIVDLVRNDLGRVCETGSVEAPELMRVESYASVHQLVSSVRGRLRADRDVFDLLRAAFPPGSMTGAPKIAAMRLLRQLESGRRGLYSGALGYLDARGGADLAVVIRSVVVEPERSFVHSGGGIVADSQAEAEWRECHDKIAPLLRALAVCRSDS